MKIEDLVDGGFQMELNLIAGRCYLDLQKNPLDLDMRFSIYVDVPVEQFEKLEGQVFEEEDLKAADV